MCRCVFCERGRFLLRACRGLQLKNATITAAVEVPAGGFKLPAPAGAGGGPPMDFSTLPAFCRVAGTLRPTSDSDIRFEVWMPLTGWNGKFVGGGNGVWAGSIAYGDMVGRWRAVTPSRRQTWGIRAALSTPTFWWAIRKKLVDFGHRAVHETTLAAKATVEAFLGRRPQRSLYVSCSTGGRIGLMEAYRYPDDYDGISATAPANPMVVADGELAVERQCHDEG
jgi:hypothetical protein